MSNFYKPSYSRGQKRSALESRDSTTRNNIAIKSRNDQMDIGNQPLIINRRNISTAQDPHKESDELLFTSNVIHKKQPSNRFADNAKETGRKIERPQSKQEPRHRGWNNSGLLLKSALIDNNNRPQTSKGQRPKPYYR